MGLGVVPLLANLLALVQTSFELYGDSGQNPKKSGVQTGKPQTDWYPSL